MERSTPTRRQFTTGFAAVGSLALAGCLNGGDDDEESSDDESDTNIDEWEPSERYTVTMHFENENGDPISSGIGGSAEPTGDTGTNYTISSTGIEEGTLSDKLTAGEYAVTVTSTDDSFDEVEKDITVDGETEVTFVLEGAEPAE